MSPSPGPRGRPRGLACGLWLTLLLGGAACGPGGHGQPTAAPPAVVSPLPPPSPPRYLARSVDHYMVNYGAWDQATIQIAQTYPLVIVHPTAGNMTRDQVAAIQGGTDPTDPTKRVLVLGYISIGEDLRTASLTYAQMQSDPRFVGDGTGPRIDPRGPAADGQSLAGLDPLGLPSNGGTGWASWYLNDNAVHNSPTSTGNGLPDRNQIFNACFVNAGDPKWFSVLQAMTLDGADGIAGLQEILTTTVGRGLGCDGVFLDTLDTCAPNSFTTASSPNESKFEWTAPGFQTFLKTLRASYPDRIVLQNRGLFFFNSELPHYAFTTRGVPDFVLFESYRLDSNVANNPDPYFYPDNRYNYAPKLMAEANRPDGFRVLSLGYADGPPDQMSTLTLLGQSTLGFDSLMEDIRVTEQLAGFRHYLTDSGVTLANTFVRDHDTLVDTTPPVWTSTYNDHANAYPTPAGEPTPRVGIQEVVAGPGSLTVRWDVALDMNRVHYALYYQTAPFDFAQDPLLQAATRLVLFPFVGQGYASGPAPGVFPYEATVANLVPGQTYYLVIRAFDESPAANEEQNQVVLSAAPLANLPYLGRWSASNGAASLSYRFEFSGSWSFARVYIDVDKSTGTGFNYLGLGADFLIENGVLYQYAGTGLDWNWRPVAPNPVQETQTSSGALTRLQWDLLQSDLGSPTTDTDLVFEVETPGTRVTGFVYEHVYTSTDPASPFLDSYAENDPAALYYHTQIQPAVPWNRVFIDEDRNSATGFPIGGLGAGYMIENGSLYRYTAVPPAWGWTYVGDAHLVTDGLHFDWWINRSDVAGASENFQAFDLIFEADSGGSPLQISPVYTQRFSP